MKSSFILREYQDIAVNKALEFIKDNPILVLPTGAGKSIIITEIAKKTNGNIIVLQPNKEILLQNYKKYKLYSEDCSIFSASCNIKEIARVCFATIGSVINCTSLFNNIKLTIIDECHLVDSKENETMYYKFLKILKVNVIGLSATPYRMHATLKYGSMTKFLHRTRERIFTKIAYNVNPSFLIENGFLCKLKYFNITLNTSILKTNTQKSDFTKTSIESLINDNFTKICKGILNVSKEHNHCLVFCSSIEICEKIAKYLFSLGAAAQHLHSKMENFERDEVIQSFKNGKIKILINVGVLTTGFDFPELDCIVLAKPTLSISLYYQMVGRGLRVAKNKEFCSIYDLCGNIKRFGKIENFEISGADGKENLYSKVFNTRTQLTHINYCF